MADDPTVSFRKSDAKRIATVVRRQERAYQGGGAEPDGRTPPQIIQRYARASGAITAGSGTGSTRTMGSGSANLCTRSAGTLTEIASLVTVYNMFDTAIDDNSWMVIGWVQGGWEVMKLGDCDNL
jgi:hypothetical protein